MWTRYVFMNSTSMVIPLTDLEELTEIEKRESTPTMAEWQGVLHDVVMDESIHHTHNIRALAQMDRITGDPQPLTFGQVELYRRQHLGDTTEQYTGGDWDPEGG